MVKQLMSNLKDGLNRNNISFSLKKKWSNLFLSTPSPNEAEYVFRSIFGLRSYSVVHRHRYTDLEDILTFAEELLYKKIQGKRFAVRAKRLKHTPISTRDIERQLGAKLKAKGGQVDLKHPEFTCYIEVRENQMVFIYSEKHPCPGGLPLHNETHALSLLSGGFDSPVASWLIMRRGLPCDFLFFELGGITQRASIYAHLHHLYTSWSFGVRPKLFVIPGHPIVQTIRETIPKRFWNVMLKRIFYQVGAIFAEKIGYAGLVTGEVISQVSSQTISNLSAIEYQINVPFLRPLLATGKEDIIALSRQIGSHDISEKVKEYCAIASESPATKSDPAYLLHLEERLGGMEFYTSLFQQKEEISLANIQPNLGDYLNVIIDHIPPNSIFLDIRAKLTPKLNHPCLRMSIEDILTQPDNFSKEATYILFCEGGMQSAEIAYVLQEEGIQAYAFEGGYHRLNKQILLAEKK